jgi:hypothetical protein
MDLQKMWPILIFSAGLVTIALAGGFGMLLMIGWIRRNQGQWKKAAESDGLAGELDEMRRRLDDLERRGLVSGEVESQYARLAELEERLDFTERLLAQRNDQSMLPGERRIP